MLPRKVQEIPGLLEGGIGWQGIVPARAAKMGSIAVDKVIAKVGTPRDFYEQLEPEKIAEHIVEVFRPDLPQLIDEIMRREHPRLWQDLPAWGRQARRRAGRRPAAQGGRATSPTRSASTSTSCWTRRSW